MYHQRRPCGRCIPLADPSSAPSTSVPNRIATNLCAPGNLQTPSTISLTKTWTGRCLGAESAPGPGSSIYNPSQYLRCSPSGSARSSLRLGSSPRIPAYPIVAVVCSCIYPLGKRVTNYSQAIPGAMFAAGFLWGYESTGLRLASQAHMVKISAGSMMGVLCLWVVMLDVIYAFQDVADDPSAGIWSMSFRFQNSSQRLFMVLGILYTTFFFGEWGCCKSGPIFCCCCRVRGGNAVRQPGLGGYHVQGELPVEGVSVDGGNCVFGTVWDCVSERFAVGTAAASTCLVSPV
ncbi:hypothetical protein BO82DRAFT_146402 [Aspergillus uvarum CBS 121591]|uniref:Uncharacterized protein n=1 Tax=Aspergillus uvarum CBS 121591 TaxID=1448315 RepID=A0A319C1S3_9EURO|nr:hypothetical protein BO82DRAFT_146402 [Aspergillus uvarum CBS 121591]PYH79034.1 hypothetical protein BO82DRAFT_146402 [Aspergillus uvarum CBS 121591]